MFVAKRRIRATRKVQVVRKNSTEFEKIDRFLTSLDPHSIPPLQQTRNSQKLRYRLLTIKEYQKAKFAGEKGKYKKAFRLFSSKRIRFTKAIAMFWRHVRES